MYCILQNPLQPPKTKPDSGLSHATPAPQEVSIFPPNQSHASIVDLHLRRSSNGKQRTTAPTPPSNPANIHLRRTHTVNAKAEHTPRLTPSSHSCNRQLRPSRPLPKNATHPLPNPQPNPLHLRQHRASSPQINTASSYPRTYTTKAARSTHQKSINKPYDTASGVTYYGFRYYDPVTGRWPSRDPIHEMKGASSYRMVENNPIKYIDYLGLDPLVGWGIGKLVSYVPGVGYVVTTATGAKYYIGKVFGVQVCWPWSNGKKDIKLYKPKCKVQCKDDVTGYYSYYNGTYSKTEEVECSGGSWNTVNVLNKTKCSAKCPKCTTLTFTQEFHR